MTEGERQLWNSTYTFTNLTNTTTTNSNYVLYNTPGKVITIPSINGLTLVNDGSEINWVKWPRETGDQWIDSALLAAPPKVEQVAKGEQLQWLDKRVSEMRIKL